MKNLLALASLLALAACGGGTADQQAFDALESAAAQPTRMRALAAPASSSAALDAERLLAFAELNYRQFFPTAERTRSLNGWVYRHYAQTGTYLAVIAGRVYVLGGPFGPEVRDVGLVSDYIGLTPLPNQAPSVGLALSLAESQPPNTVTLVATAADADGSIARVEFFNGSSKLGETTREPHVLSLATPRAGLHELTAVATDDAGLSATSPVRLLLVTADGATPPAPSITVASLARCATALGSSSADSHQCLVGSTAAGSQVSASDKACTLTVSAAGVVTVSTDGQNLALSVPQLPAGERFFTKTATGMSFDYGSSAAASPALRIRARTEDKVLGQFFEQGGNLIVEVRRGAPATDLSCVIPLAMS